MHYVFVALLEGSLFCESHQITKSDKLVLQFDVSFSEMVLFIFLSLTMSYHWTIKVSIVILILKIRNFQNFKEGIEPVAPKCYMLLDIMSKSSHKVFGGQGPFTGFFRFRIFAYFCLF